MRTLVGIVATLVLVLGLVVVHQHAAVTAAPSESAAGTGSTCQTVDDASDLQATPVAHTVTCPTSNECSLRCPAQYCAGPGLQCSWVANKKAPGKDHCCACDTCSPVSLTICPAAETKPSCVC